ncbi:MAG: peptidoglycan DD-metalloendopeptidase family protein [Ignavibacteria bacterium]|jgi:septal ring factor EnvC (AmiA/AmiB activator)|nr:peptidoglycan DD-metalloendopeptidase family protein [Ignavibacteria bacterium]MDH7527277.1 peptidoglycan DD-metalloendopeptidase family protein [Ignavibacteria bacterium]
MVNILRIIFFISFLFLSAYSQKSSEIQTKREELNRIRKEIEQLDKKLKETISKEKQNLNIIDEYDKQVRLIQNLIQKLSEEEKRLNDEIKIRENELLNAEKELNALRSEYELNIVNLYKFGRKNPFELLLTSKSVNQALVRYKYLEKFTEDRKRRIELINNKSKEVAEERSKLITVLNDKERLRKEKSIEENQLQNKIKEKRNLISELRKNKEVYLKDLERKKQSAQKIAALIDQLIEQKRREEIAARERELERKRKREQELKEKRSSIKAPDYTKKETTVDTREEDSFFNLPQFSSFSKMKGNLPWPVNGRIVNKFGEQRNPYLNTVTLNFGIDIATPYGSPVRSIADGKVSIIHWLPGYGNIIIISHSENYRTIYAYLSEVLVNEGDIVKRGDIIAKSGESLTGEMLHLEIWKEREKQNPEHWLARR